MSSNPEAMENSLIPQYHHQDSDDEAEDALSLCNLPINGGDDEDQDQDQELEHINNQSSDQEEVFEFFKINPQIPQPNNSQNHIFCGKLIQSKQHLKPPTSKTNAITSSPAVTGNCHHYPSAAESPLASKSFRRLAFSFGMVKFPQEMELSDMKRRQSRLPSAPMFPASDEVSGKGKGRGGRGPWGLIRLLRSRSHFGSAFARSSLGAISLV